MDWLKLVGGYSIEDEKRDELLSTSVSAQYASVGEIPERVDPRKSPLAEQAWLQVENQGSIGSCAGNALTENMEYCWTVESGEVVQLSRMYAYLLSQKFDGITSDRGSTLSGNTKAGLQGICRESIAPYPSSYPGHGWMTDAMRADAEKYKIKSHTPMKSAEECRAYIGSGIGIIQIGIAWGNAMEPDSNGCIRRFAAGGGGHSVVYAGYIPDDDIKQRSSKGYWLLLKNSWGRRWGKDGYAYVDTSAVDQMLKHQFTVFYGRSDMGAPRPRPLPVDFTKPKESRYA